MKSDDENFIRLRKILLLFQILLNVFGLLKNVDKSSVSINKAKNFYHIFHPIDS